LGNGISGLIVNWAVLNWIDWAIIAVLSVSTLISLWRGFAREALSLAGWVAAFVLANLFASRLAVLLAEVIDNESARYVAAFAILLVCVLILSRLLGVLVSRLISITGLGLLDRMLGTVFGFTRGVILLLVVFYLVIELLPADNQQALRQSQLVPHFDMLMQWVQSMFGRMTITSVAGSDVPVISI